MNKEQVLQYLDKEEACSTALDWFIDQTGTLEKIYNECWVDWRIWLHAALGLNQKPFERYNVINSGAHEQYKLTGGVEAYAVYINKMTDAWQILQDETMEDWAVVEKALQEAIDSS